MNKPMLHTANKKGKKGRKKKKENEQQRNSKDFKIKVAKGYR